MSGRIQLQRRRAEIAPQRFARRSRHRYDDVELEGNPPGVILRAIDFRPALK
jgi:hypothetical protein